MNDKLEYCWNQNSYLNEYIKHADAKAIAFLGLETFVAGFLLSQQKEILAFVDHDPMRLLFLWIAVVVFLAALTSVLLVIWPRTTPKSGTGHLFWGNVAAFDDKAAYLQSFQALTSDDLEKELINQNFHLSTVTATKYKWVARATKWLLFNIVLWTTFIVLVNQVAQPDTTVKNEQPGSAKKIGGFTHPKPVLQNQPLKQGKDQK